MHHLFGIPVESLALVLTVLIAIGLGVIAAFAVRNRIFLRLGLRNVGRRRSRGALIVVGLMLGTAIITAALATGDTMSQTIRSGAATALGKTDEVIAVKGIEAALSAQQTGAGAGTATRYMSENDASRIAASTRRTGLVKGAAPVIVETIAVQDVTSRQNEARVTLFASDPAKLGGFGAIRTDGKTVSLSDLDAGEVYLNTKGADKLNAKAGDTLLVLVGYSRLESVRVQAVVRYAGAATDGAAVLMPLAAAQKLLDKPGQVTAVFVANKGGVGKTNAVVAALKPAATALGLEIDKTKQNALTAADTVGAMFMAFFTTFGSFSIASGILLIFLIFVMLAAERRGELGIARAVGTRRGHIVQMFVYEGAAYDVVAALLGVVVGIGVAYGMVLAMAAAFAATGDFTISYAVKPASIVLAYSIGVFLTLGVVAFSAWRVSRMNIVSAIRNLPDPPHEQGKRRRRWVLPAIGLALGGLLAVSGLQAKDAISLGLGVSVVLLSLVPVLRMLRVSERAVHTGVGLGLVTWFVLPIPNWLFGPMKVNFSIFILGGLMIVIGGCWALMYNADVLLGVLSATIGRVKRIAPVFRMAMAYPLRSLFRTGVTLAMFMLVVFTLVVGATTTAAFTNAFNDVNSFGGGFDVLATAAPQAPVPDMRAAANKAPGIDPTSIRRVASFSSLAVKARQLGTGSGPETYLLHGADSSFLSHTTYRLASTARGYSSPRAVWSAIRDHPGLAVVDPLAVPRKQNWGFGGMSKFRLHGFYIEDKGWAPVKVSVRDPQTGKHLDLTVIGVLSDTAPLIMSGIWTSQAALTPVFGDRVQPTGYLFALTPGTDAKAVAASIESAFLANGMQADSLKKLLADTVSANLTLNRLIEGFMGLGLITGIAALGVITARAVVERRQQIGVLRAIGFQSRMVQLSFLLESSFIALTAIVVGTILGLAVAFTVIHDAQTTPSWSNISFDVPWLTLGVIFLAVYAVALLTTLAPARRAARIYPAQALRYQ
jgi:putative ABC transport system permease protein